MSAALARGTNPAGPGAASNTATIGVRFLTLVRSGVIPSQPDSGPWIELAETVAYGNQPVSGRIGSGTDTAWKLGPVAGRQC
jgi:hypothetical protein